jgi:molecular chaperone DnaK
LQREFAPEEISAMVLRKMAEEANRYLGEPVTGAVITVPAYFNDAQRQATRDAGRIAGLEVLRILNEPTAASLAYGLDRADNQTILVFDLGGGTFDVSILDVGDGVFEVRATAGDTQLGGTDFDKKIVDWLADQFLETEGIDLRRDRQSLQRLMEAAEKAKIELSGVSTTEINLPFIAATEEGPKHLETRLTRSQFEGFCGDLIGRLRGPVKQALSDAQLSPAQIDEVVLVGGSTRMPMVKQLVRSLINLEPNENVNPDEVVAVGAAIQAGILTQEVRDILLLDVTPLSLGLETIGGVMKRLIPRNTTIPVRRSDVFSTAENNQTLVEIHIVQGEREMAVDNKSIGRFKLMGIPPAPRGVPQVLVSFDIDANGILQVTAVDKTTGREQGITIQGASTLSEAEVQRMIQDAERFADQDRSRRERVEKKTRAEALTFQAERLLREVALDFGMQFASGHRRRIENLIKELRNCLQQGDERGIDIAQADLQDALYELNREVYQFDKEEEEEGGILGSIKRTLFGDDDDLDYWDSRDRPDPWDTRRNTWDAAPRRDSWDTRQTPRDTWDRRDTRDTWDRQDSWNRPEPRDTWDRQPPPRDRREERQPTRNQWDDRDVPRESLRDRQPSREWDERNYQPSRNQRDEGDREPLRDRSQNRDSWNDRTRNGSPPAQPPRRPPYANDPNRYDDEDWGDEDEWL